MPKVYSVDALKNKTSTLLPKTTPDPLKANNIVGTITQAMITDNTKRQITGEGVLNLKSIQPIGGNNSYTIPRYRRENKDKLVKMKF